MEVVSRARKVEEPLRVRIISTAPALGQRMKDPSQKVRARVAARANGLATAAAAATDGVVVIASAAPWPVPQVVPPETTASST